MILYPHQLSAIDKLTNGCILNGGTGSGKSLTAIAYYYMINGGYKKSITSSTYVKLNKDPVDLYIITTARKRDEHDWDKELSHFMMSTDPEKNIYGNKIVVDSWNLIDNYLNVQNAFFIFDEQRVVGYGLWAKSFIRIAQNKNNRWLLLSATPGDKWEDYMSVFIANRFYKNKTDFVTQHIIYDRRFNFPKVAGYINERKLDILRDRILVDMEFCRKTIPHHRIIRTEYDRDLYNMIYKDRKNPDKYGYIPVDPEEYGALLIGEDIALKDVAPIMEGWDYKPSVGDYVKFEYAPIQSPSEYCYQLRKIVNSDRSKLDQVRSILSKHNRVIIFYKYNYELYDLRKEFENDPDYEIGEWNGHKHQPVPTSDNWIYLVQYSAGCEGWNCIETNSMIFYSPDYSYKVMIQACGRIDRINTPFIDLYYYHLLSKSTIDGAITKALKSKKNFNEGHFSNKIFA